MKQNNDIFDDDELRALLMQNADTPHDNPWFTRKVLNRLPERHSGFGWIENATYLIGIIICIAVIAYMAFTVKAITPAVIMQYMACGLTCMILAVAFVYRSVSTN